MIAGVVLAAGTASRFGRQKLVAPLAGKPLARWTVERVLASRVDEVIVVLGREADAVRAALNGLGVRYVVNARFQEGMGTSLAAGISALAAGTRAALVALGDQPSVTPAIIDALVAEYERSHAPIVAPRYAGERGNPVLFDASLFPELRAVTGDQGARAVIARDPSRVATVPFSFPMPRDVDSAEDLSALERREIARAAERSDADAWEDVCASAPAPVAAACGVRMVRIGGAVAGITAAVDVLALNRVVGIGIDEPATERMVDELVGLYRSAGARRFFVQLSPEAQPATLADWLHARGFAHYNSWVKLYRGVEPLPLVPDAPRVERIGAEHAATFAQIVAMSFGMPESVQPWLAATVGRGGWRHYIAIDGDAPIATAALFVRDGVGWLGFAATRPAHRGHGAQSALIAQRIRDGGESGCSLLITETAEDTPERPSPSLHNMVRSGFRVVYRRPNYLFQMAAL